MTKQLPIGSNGVDKNAVADFTGGDFPCEVKITSHFAQKMIFPELDLTIQSGETVVKTVQSQDVLQRFVSSAAQVAFLNRCDLGLVLETDILVEPPKPEENPVLAESKTKSTKQKTEV
jgi:hypothetical protein